MALAGLITKGLSGSIFHQHHHHYHPFCFAFLITRGEKAKTCEAIWCRHQFSLRCQEPIFKSWTTAKSLLLLHFLQIPKCCSSTGNLLWRRTSLRRGLLCAKDFTSGGRQGRECQWGNILGELLTSCCCSCHKHRHFKCGNQYKCHHQWAREGCLFPKNLWHLSILCPVWHHSQHLSTVKQLNVD